MRIFAGPGEFAAAAGDDLGTTEWTGVDQACSDSFAGAPDVRQWHVATTIEIQGRDRPVAVVGSVGRDVA